MKNTLKCPKCGGKKIWVLEKYRIPGESGQGRQLHVVPHQEEAKTGLFQSLRANPQGHFDLLLCHACGYSELWAAGFEGLVESPSHGIRLIDSSDAGAGPFR
jgi:predicted nucleic-acid-binding Zn-ribbon protein